MKLLNPSITPSILQALHGRPTQVTRYNTGIERTTQIPLQLPTTLTMNSPMEPTMMQQSDTEKLSQAIKDANNPLVQQERQEAQAENLLNVTDNMEAIQTGLAKLKALNIKDPVILEKMKKLEERAAAHQIAAGGDPQLADDTTKERKKRARVMANSMQADTAANKESVAASTKSKQEAADNENDRIALMGPRPDDADYVAADMNNITARLNTFPDTVIRDKKSPNNGMNPSEEILKGTWGEGSKYRPGNDGASNALVQNMKNLKSSVSEDQIIDVYELSGVVLTELDNFLRTAAIIGTTPKSALKTMNRTSMFAAAQVLHDKMRKLEPNASQSQLEAMALMRNAALSHVSKHVKKGKYA